MSLAYQRTVTLRSEELTADLPQHVVKNQRARGLREGAASRTILSLIVVLILSVTPGCCRAQTGESPAQQIEEHLRLAQDALAAHAPDRAAHEFEAILAIDGNDPTALANLGALAFVRGDWAAAAAKFTQALQSAPTLTKAKGLLAICDRRLGRPGAQAALETAFPVVEDKNIRVQVGLELVGLYESQADTEQAAALLGTLLRIAPDNVDVLYVAQRTFQEMANGTLDKLAVLAPRSARMQQVIAEHLINAGDLPGAIEHYRAALKINPNLQGVHYEIGESILQDSVSEEAMTKATEEFQAAIRVDGDSSGAEERLGAISGLRNQQEQAFDHYSRAYALNPNDPNAQLGLAEILMQRNQPQEAMPYLRRLVEADPMNTEARYRLATVCKRLGLTEEANQQLALFREAKTARTGVENVYMQMNRPPVKHADETASETK